MKKIVCMGNFKDRVIRNKDKLESILWSIALPGLSQILNGHLFKGILFLAMEFLINVKSYMNRAIVLSFQGNTQAAICQTDYQWLMFYPCVYMFAIWDGYKHAGGANPPFVFLPFAFSAFLGTIGVVYSSNFTIGGILPGPIFLPISGIIAGILLGKALMYLILKPAG